MKWIFTATVISLIFILACFILPQWEIAQWWKNNPSLKGTQNETTTREKPTNEPETIEDKLKELKALEAELARGKKRKAEGDKRLASIKHQMEQTNQAILALQDSVTDPNGPLTAHEKQQLAKVISDLEAIGIEEFESIRKQGIEFLGVDENEFFAEEDAFDESLSESDLARYLILLAEWVRTGETDAVERFRAEHGHPDP